MTKLENTGKAIEKKFTSFLSGKPIWIWWICYVLLIGVLFGLFYVVVVVLTKQWWASVLIIIVAGMIWGTVMYMNSKPAAAPVPAPKVNTKK